VVQRDSLLFYRGRKRVLISRQCSGEGQRKEKTERFEKDQENSRLTKEEGGKKKKGYEMDGSVYQSGGDSFVKH